MRNKNSVFLKPEKIKIKRAGRMMMDAGSSYLPAKDYTSFHKKILWKNIDLLRLQ